MTQTSSKPPPQNANNGFDQYHTNGLTDRPVEANLISPPQQTFEDTESIEPRRRLRGLSLRTKATALAIILGTLPVIGTGATAYYLANQAVVNQIGQTKQARATDLADQINRFIFERYGDVQIMSSLPIFTDPKLRATTTIAQKQAALNRFLDAYQVYDSIGLFELNGNLIVQTIGKPLPNPKDQNYFQEAIKTGNPVISGVQRSRSTGQLVINFAAPVKDAVTGKTIAIVTSRMPANRLEDLLKKYENAQDEYILSDASGKVFIASHNEYSGKDTQTIVEGWDQLKAAKKPANRVILDQVDKEELLVGYSPTEKLPGLPQLDWDIIVGTQTRAAFAPQRQLLLALLLGTGLTAVLISAIAAYLANRATRPILAATVAVEKLGQGELDTRVAVAGEDELAVLGSNINRMAVQMQTLLEEQEEANRQQLAVQEEIARQQLENAEQQRIAKEQLQKRALELLMEVDPVSSGDLTIRANVTEDEIGTVADSYNNTIASLRKIVTQVQAAAQQVTATTSSSEVSVSELSTEALRQAEEISAALDRIQEMSNSIRAVAQSASQAESAVQQANQTVEEGDAAMNRTVEGIMAIRETVAETSTKVKRLGESSQKVSKVVNLIGRFAAQTNLLALKASIEAARAGEEGRGFAVLADEVRSLARQSAEATAEIESLVTNIQTETNEVVAAMEAGTQQVAEGTRLVDETRQSLNKITAVSAQIGALVEAIALATVEQSQVSESVTQTMSDVASIATQTSLEATEVSASFKELLAVAQELQASAGKFKVS